MEGLRRRFKLYSKRDESLEPHQDDDDALPEDPVPREQGNAAQIKNVAKAMFSSMCEGFDVEVITKANIDNAIQNLVLSKVTPTKSLIQSSIYAASSKKLKESIRKLLNDAMQKSKNNEVTCDLFCDRALQYSDGNISLMDMLEGEIPDVDIKKQDRANLGNFFDYPVHTMRVMKKEILKTVERRGVKWLWSTFSTKHFYLLIGAYFLPMMTLQFIISSVTTALFTGAILAMLLITIQIAVNSEKYQIRMDYLSLFQYFNGPELRIDIKMPKSDLIYYGNFFLALVVALGTSGFSNKDVINSELLVVLCVFVAFVIFLQFDLYESKLAYLLIVAKAPSWVLLVLEKLYLLLGYPSDDLLSWSRLLLPGMGFSISVVSLLQIAAHLYLIVSQLKDLEWKTFFSFHGPHLLFLCWLVLCRNFVSEADPATMLKITTTIALIPVYTFVFLSSPLYFLYFYGFTPPFFYSFFFVALVALFGVVLLYLYVYMKSLWIAISLDHVLLLVMVLLIPLLLYLSSWYASMYQPPPLPPVTTDQYVGPETGMTEI